MCRLKRSLRRHANADEPSARARGVRTTASRTPVRARSVPFGGRASHAHAHAPTRWRRAARASLDFLAPRRASRTGTGTGTGTGTSRSEHPPSSRGTLSIGPVAAVVTWEELDINDVPAEPAGSRRVAAQPAPLSVDSDGSAAVELSDSLAALLDRPDRHRSELARAPTRRARWRRLLARQALVEKGLDTLGSPPPDRPERLRAAPPLVLDGSPRSSLDLEEPRSLASWDGACDAEAPSLSLEPPSPTLRSWRSVSSRSFHKRPDEAPRPLAAIGRQCCMNDISHLVDAANSPHISYDRQIFDRASKLWRYVEADAPDVSSPWELGLAPASLGSPVTTRSTPASVTATPSLPTPAAMHAAARRAPHRRQTRFAWGSRGAAGGGHHTPRRMPSAHSEDGMLHRRSHSNLSGRYRSSLETLPSPPR